MLPLNYFRYTFTSRLGNEFVAPLGESDFKIEWTRADDQRMDYKSEFPNKMVIAGDAFTNLIKLEKSVYRCEFISVSIERNCGGWVPWFSGRISLNDGSWDLDRCTVSIKLNELEPTQCIDTWKSEKIDLFAFFLDPTNRKTVRLYPETFGIEYVEYSSSVDFTPTPCLNQGPYWAGPGTAVAGGWSDYYHYWHDVQIHIPQLVHRCSKKTKWARYTLEVSHGTPPPPGSWILISTGTNDKYAKPVSVYNCTVTSESSGGIDGYEKTCDILGAATSLKTIDNGLYFNDLLAAYVSNICPGKTVVSNFFQINPTLATTINYVTGQPSKVSNLIIFQKSDVKRPNVSGNATKLPISFENLLSVLVVMFNLRWRIVGNNFLLEHVSYFSRNNGFDLTGSAYSKFVKGLRRYTYETDKIPQREEFEFMEASAGDFAGLPITYAGACVAKESRKNIITYTAENVTTDIELCMNNPDPDSTKVSDQGMVIVATEIIAGEYRVITEAGILSATASRLNNSLSWAALHRDYHKYYRPLKSGNMNGQPTIFNSVVPTKRGETISIPLCCTDIFNPDDKITTPLGTGIVSKATFSFKDNMLALDLLYEPEEGLVNNTAPVATSRVIHLVNSAPLTFDVLADTTDAEGGPLVIDIIIQPTNGTAAVVSNQIVYTPNATLVSNDSIVYQIIDNWGERSDNAIIALLYP